MFVTVDHHIKDADKFFAAAERELSHLPPNLKLHLSTPSKDGKTAFCLWETDCLDNLRNWLEGVTGDVSDNVYHEIAEERAYGLPVAPAAETTSV